MKVTTDRTFDFHDLDALAKGIVHAGMSNEEKALACFDVVRWGMFQYPWVYNIKERREEWHDATKLLNVYGHGLCGVQARTLGAIYQKVFGYENQRLIGVNECAPGDWELEKDAGAFVFSRMGKGYSPENHSGHSCVEVFYDDHWHHLDPMVNFYCYTRDGNRIASLEDTIADPSLVMQPSRDITGLMPDGNLGKVFYKSRFADWGPGPGYFMVMDTCMEVALDKGQSVTYFWDREHQRFHWPNIWAEKFVQDYFDEGPRHPNPHESTWRHYGNGTFTTVKDRVTERKSLKLTFPYVLVGGTLQFEAESNSSTIRLVCQKDGTCEEEIVIQAGTNKIRLDDFVMGGYDLEIRVLGGDIGQVSVDLYFQHNFITRPRLLCGENTVTVSDEKSDPLHVIWEWEEKDGKLCKDDRRVHPGVSYSVSVGELDFEPEENPKYMKRLEVRR
ncbi:MAG: hypothetical protein HN521_21995 [Candidatus Latescibacteria bacterium]|jgi:hypothetical protein|nr:hypothetical protein [Candidatus Latescibacterota bacterium]MBT5831737.1 hypothetical protein [Candidatus Latescibacterota bacterium]